MPTNSWQTNFISVGPFSTGLSTLPLPRGPRLLRSLAFAPFNDVLNLPVDMWTHAHEAAPAPNLPGNVTILDNFFAPPGGSQRPNWTMHLCLRIPDDHVEISTRIVNPTAQCYFNILTGEWEYGIPPDRIS